jgi:hypothetical protein
MGSLHGAPVCMGVRQRDKRTVKQCMNQRSANAPEFCERSPVTECPNAMRAQQAPTDSKDLETAEWRAASAFKHGALAETTRPTL